MKKRVVVTGMGAISPIGLDVQTMWQAMKAGEHGFCEIDAFDTGAYKAKIAGQIKDFDPAAYMQKREYSRMDRYCQFAIAAAMEAAEQAGLEQSGIDPERLGVCVGTGVGGIGTTEREVTKLNEKGPNRINMLLVPMMISNMAAGNIAIKYGAKAECIAVVTACATGTQSIGEAYRQIKFGLADMMICGGSEAAITPVSVAGFIQITALSLQTDPDRASIPFDKRRDGFVMGEGAGILVLEELEHAKKRGANILGEIVGYGSTCDAYHMTAPDPQGDGGARAMKLAMRDAGVDRVEYINAHGTSTPYNDKTETLAIKAALGKQAYNTPVSSTKSVTGHMLGAAGAVEAIACIKAIEEGFVPPTAGYREADAECDLDYVPNTGRKAEIKTALSNSLGFGGHNATLAFGKYEV